MGSKSSSRSTSTTVNKTVDATQDIAEKAIAQTGEGNLTFKPVTGDDALSVNIMPLPGGGGGSGGALFKGPSPPSSASGPSVKTTQFKGDVNRVVDQTAENIKTVGGSGEYYSSPIDYLDYHENADLNLRATATEGSTINYYDQSSNAVSAALLAMIQKSNGPSSTSGDVETSAGPNGLKSDVKKDVPKALYREILLAGAGVIVASYIARGK